MRYTLVFDGQPIGDVDLDAEQGPSGERQGRFAPNARYAAVRDRVRAPLAGLAALPPGTGAEQIRAYLAGATADTAAQGLSLQDAAGRRVRTTFLLVGDPFPSDVDPQLLALVPLPATAILAPDV